jgi:hypothetical protein
MGSVLVDHFRIDANPTDKEYAWKAGNTETETLAASLRLNLLVHT